MQKLALIFNPGRL